MGVDVDGLLHVIDRFVEAAGFSEGDGQGGVDGAVVAGQFQGALVGHYGLVVVAIGFMRDGQADVRGEIAVVDGEGAVVMGDRVIDSAAFEQDVGQVVVSEVMSRVDVEGVLIMLNCLVVAVRKIEKIVAFDIKPDVMDRFVEEMGEKTGLEVESTESAESAESAESTVRASDIVTMLISSPRPTIKSAWIRPGAVVVAASGFGQDLYKDDVYRNVDNVVMDDWGSYVNDCLDDIGVTEQDRQVDTVLVDNWKKWKDGADPSSFPDRVLKGEYGLQLPQIVLGKQPARKGAEDSSVFLHAGMGANFVAAGHLIYTRARERGMGVAFKLV